MKKLLFIAISMTIISISIYSKDIPVIKAEIGHIVDFSEESQKVFNIIHAENFEEKSKLTEKEKRKLKDKAFRERYIEDTKNSEFYDGQKLNIWQILGDLEKNLDFYPYPYKIKASSYLKAENGINYSPLNINDNSFKTAWIEGNDNYGKKEWIECYMSKKYDGDPDISSIYIFNGYVKSNKSFIENSRVKKLKMYVCGKEYVILNLEDTSSQQIFKIPPIKYQDLKQINTYSGELVIRFEIMEVYPGTKYKDTAITEILFYQPTE